MINISVRKLVFLFLNLDDCKWWRFDLPFARNVEGLCHPPLYSLHRPDDGGQILQRGLLRCADFGEGHVLFYETNGSLVLNYGI